MLRADADHALTPYGRLARAKPLTVCVLARRPQEPVLVGALMALGGASGNG